MAVTEGETERAKKNHCVEMLLRPWLGKASGIAVRGG